MAESGTPTAEYDRIQARVENIGGIEHCAVTLDPGVTILTGRNATNRTSFLTALADILGGPSATLKSDAETGRIELDIDGSTYSKEYTRKGDALVSQGTQFTDQTDVVELFARVLEDNPARRAVERGEQLRDLVMRPVDTDEIEREIREHRRERNRIEERLAEIEEERNRLPQLESRRRSLRSDIDEITEQIEELQERIEDREAPREETEHAEDLLDELEDRRQSIRETERQIADREDELDRLESNLEELDEAFGELDVPEDELERIESELEARRRRKRELTEAIENLERILQFNEELLSEGPSAAFGRLGEEDDDVTVDLDPSSKTIDCWTCGTTIEREAIEDRLDELRDVVRERRAKESDLESEIADLREQQTELERKRDRRRDMEEKRERIEQQIDYQRNELQALRDRREELRSELEEIEAQVEEAGDVQEADVVDEYGRLSDLEYERGTAETELARVVEEIQEIEELADERDRLEVRREELSGELSQLRSRIDDLEADAVEQFNDHMDALLDLLGYENLTRVWLERVRSDDSERATSFELHIVRRGSADAVYEDVVDNLSESEREVVGLVVALAGYLVHDVHETVPFMLLDSLEALDSERIARLVDYFQQYVPFLVVALLPEDAAALDDAYDRVPASQL